MRPLKLLIANLVTLALQLRHDPPATMINPEHTVVNSILRFSEGKEDEALKTITVWALKKAVAKKPG